LSGPPAKTALMSGSTMAKAFVYLPGGGTAIYNSSGLASYRHSDWLGSSRLTSTQARGLYSSSAYAPFGEQYATSGTSDASFTGQNADTAMTLYDFTFREHSPSQGRWISPDPLGVAAVYPTNPQSWNRYAYVINSPLGSVDPLGLISPCPPGSGINILNPDGTTSCGPVPPGGGGVGTGSGGLGDNPPFAPFQDDPSGGPKKGPPQPTKKQCMAAAQAQHNTAMDEISNRTPWVDALLGMSSGAILGGAYGCLKTSWLCEATDGASALPETIEGAASGTAGAMVVWTALNMRDQNKADAAFVQQVNNVCNKLAD